jgi:hypothetical protein
MSHRLQVVLPDPVAIQLRELASSAGEPPSTLAGQLVRSGVAQASSEGKVRSLRPAPPLVGGQNPGRARWLEPYGGDGRWLQEMWGAIVALHGRYPRLLEALKDEWWTDDAHTETLCALAVWRAEIDDVGEDPREELAFQTQLADYAHTLRQQGGGVARAWKPGAAPEEWRTSGLVA